MNAMRSGASSVAVIGAGGHARVVAAALVASGLAVEAFYDDDPELWGQQLDGISIVGPIDAIRSERSKRAILGIGDNAMRKRVAEGLDLEWATVIHPFSWVDPGVSVGPGTVVCAGAIVQAGAVVGSHVILNTKASIDHDVRIGDFVHVAVAHLAGGASAGDGAFVALGSTVLPGISLGAWATVGAGSLVRKDVAPGSTVVGVPARTMRTSSE
jgi:acetyltransferase EpsM